MDKLRASLLIADEENPRVSINKEPRRARSQEYFKDFIDVEPGNRIDTDPSEFDDKNRVDKALIKPVIFEDSLEDYPGLLVKENFNDDGKLLKDQIII
jgi:hypothetical protein